MAEKEKADKEKAASTAAFEWYRKCVRSARMEFVA
ncbi:hypothetical protein X743_15410 [Mesorhizobium sp. LNHC252B00]|nr:hypothetical protein X743_15410 [Mesorhizobium sp. LNHC252B00]